MSSPLPAAEFDANIQPQLWAAMITTRALALIFVGLRFLARRVGGVRWWWDDWIMLGLAVLVLIPEFGLVIAVIVLGTGRHIQWVLANTPQVIPTYLKVVYADTLTYPLVITPVKCSFLCLYIRLFGIRRWYRVLCQIVIAISITWGLVTFFIFAFQCSPISDAWTPTRVGCMDFATLFLGTNVPNVVIDFLILALPVYPIWNLQIPLVKKLVINAILAVGVAEVAISIVRVTTLSRLSFQDATWDDATALIWSEIESNIGVICCNLPVLGPLLPKRLREKLVATISSNRHNQKSSSVRLGYLRQADTFDEAQKSLARGNYSNASGIRRTTAIHITDHDDRANENMSQRSDEFHAV